MTLIQNENELRRYIPNAFTTVKGETPLLQKLTPYLESAELWLKQYFTGGVMFEAVQSLATHIVVNKAMRQAVPSLDLVLTPNGFGIVSNSNIAPASKERVERLIASLESERDNYIEQLLPLLVQSEEWRGTEQYCFFTSTLFPNITLATLCGYHTNRWKHSSHRPCLRTKKRVKGIGFRKIFYLCNAVLTARHIDCSYLPPNYHIIVKMNKTNTQELALTRCELLLGVCWAVVGLVVTSLSLHLFLCPLKYRLLDFIVYHKYYHYENKNNQGCSILYYSRTVAIVRITATLLSSIQC